MSGVDSGLSGVCGVRMLSTGLGSHWSVMGGVIRIGSDWWLEWRDRQRTLYLECMHKQCCHMTFITLKYIAMITIKIAVHILHFLPLNF